MFDQEPVGYAELCSQLRDEKDPKRFKLILEQIDTLLKEQSCRHFQQEITNVPRSYAAGIFLEYDPLNS